MEELNLAQVETQKRPTLVSSPLLHKDLDGKERFKRWNYRSVIVMLTCLQEIYAPDISMALRRYARFSSNPKLMHEHAVARIVRCLIDTIDHGFLYKVDHVKGFEYFVDTDFAGG